MARLSFLDSYSAEEKRPKILSLPEAFQSTRPSP